MSRVFDIRCGVPRSSYGLDLQINDEELDCLDVSDLYNSISSVKYLRNKPVHVKLIIDGEHSFLEYSSFFTKIEEATSGNVRIDVYTSGSNFDSLMECIGIRNSGVDCAIHIDDQNVRGVIDTCEIDFSKAVCPCYLSKRYVRNLDDEEFRRIYNSNMFKFNREEALAERKIIREVWKKISPVTSAIDRLSPLSKVVLVADYINSNISYAHDGHRLVGQHADGRNHHIVEEWASNGLLTYERKKGVCTGQSDLACILLDNYLAKTNCCSVSGYYAPTRDGHQWIVLPHKGKNYGVCLTMSKRFVDLSKVGYLEGEVFLEREHSGRSDYKINIDSYEDVPGESYTIFRKRTYDNLMKYQKSGANPPQLPPRKEPKNVLPIPLPPLPPRKNINSTGGYQYKK